MKTVCILSSVHNALDNRIFYRQARSLQRAGYHVILIAPHPISETIDGVEIIGLPRVKRIARPLLWLRLIKLAIRTHADVYHFHDPELLFVIPVVRLLTRRPAIYDIHEVNPDFFAVKDYLPVWVRYPLAWIFRWLEPLLAGMQSGLIFADDQIANYFLAINKPKATLYNFPGRFFLDQALSSDKPVPTRSPLVLHLGGHERNRGTRLMVESFTYIVKALPEARLRLVGHFVPPSLQAEMEAGFRAAGIWDCVEITGQVPFDTVGAHLQAAQVGWVAWQPYPKNQKNIPTKLFEYMAYSVPIVCSDLTSTRAFVKNGVNGYLVDPTDPAAHARAIIEILNNPDQAQKLGQAGRKMVEEEFTWEKMEPRLLYLYRQVLLG